MDNYKPDDIKQLAVSMLKVMSHEQRLELITILKTSLNESKNLDPGKLTNSVPLSIFSSSLSCFETIVVYLIDNQKISIKNTSLLTGRKNSTIYATYYAAKKKFAGELLVDKNSIMIPISILTGRKYSVLESITAYLHDNHNMSITEIATKLSRKYNTIKTIYQRYKTKLHESRVVD